MSKQIKKNSYCHWRDIKFPSKKCISIKFMKFLSHKEQNSSSDCKFQKQKCKKSKGQEMVAQSNMFTYLSDKLKLKI